MLKLNGQMQLLIFIFGLILFIGLVLVHEWGHFIMARRNGVEVEEFGLGFPPRAKGKKLKSGMILSLNWLPLGGFVKMKGEHDNDLRPGSFGAASLGAKSKIMLAGVTMNLIAGLLLLTLLALIGMPKLLTKDNVGQDQFTVASDTKVIKQEVLAGYVDPGSPADHAGLSLHDDIQVIAAGADKRVITTADQLRQATDDFAGRQVQITYSHQGTQVTKSAQLLSNKQVAASSKTANPKAHLGVIPTEFQVRRSTWSAPVVALGFTKQLIVLTVEGLGHALSGLGSWIGGFVTRNHTASLNGGAQAESQVGGPVAIMEVLWNSGSLGINFMLMIIAIISLTLALMNAIPFIPALDGGRLAMMLVARGILKKPLSQQLEERLVGSSMAVLLLLMVLITIVDLKR